MSVRLISRALLVAGAGAIALVGVQAPAQAAGVDASKIDTYSSWDGSSTLQPFGHPDSATYGQVITVPAGDKRVASLTYYMAAGGVSGTVVMRGAVYSWDGAKAVKKVAETKKMSLDVTAGDPTFNPVKFKFKKAKVKAGQQYVLFATISKDYEETDPGVGTIWPVHTSDVLAGGNTVWINDAGNEALWTTQAWSGISTYDMAFKATLK